MRISYLLLPIVLFAGGCEASSKDNTTAPPTKALQPSKSAQSGEPPPEADAVPPAPDSAEAAADVLQTYFALIAARKYKEARELWGHGGEDSGMSLDAFAAAFDKYASYEAEVGAPGAVDAGMMQRWVEVPVKISGTMKDGKPFAMEGPVILHHIAREMDGVSPEEKEWRIRDSSGVKPRPAS